MKSNLHFLMNAMSCKMRRLTKPVFRNSLIMRMNPLWNSQRTTRKLTLRNMLTTKTLPKNISERKCQKSMLRTNTSSALKLNVSDLSRNTQDTELFATTVRSKQSQESSGNGTKLSKSGTDTLTTTRNGCTGDHQSQASLLQDGLTTEATGIMVDSHTNTPKDLGIDSKTEGGRDMTNKYQSSQVNQESERNAEPSTRE